MRALHTAATGMAAQELNVQVISNNIANLRTTGYKKQRVAFQDLIYDHVRRVGAQASDQGTVLPVGVDLGGGVKTVGTPGLMTQGTLSQTGNDLDIAIRGEGFFKIQMPDGTYSYTRDGSFQMDAQGRVVNAQGNPVQPTITIPQNSSGLTINAQGQVTVTLPGSTTPTNVGQIGLTRFINKAGLQPVGDNLFTETPASGPPQDGIANAGPSGKIAIYRAPELGTTGTLSTAQVLSVLRAHQVIGVDTRDLREISVTRLARTLLAGEIELAIASALEHRHGFGDAANLSLTFDRELADIKLEASNSGALLPASVRYEARGNRFDVAFEFGSDNVATPVRLRFTGTVVETVEAAVLARGIERNEVIKSSDLVIERRPKTEVGADGATRDRAVGMQARPPLLARPAVRA